MVTHVIYKRKTELLLKTHGISQSFPPCTASITAIMICLNNCSVILLEAEVAGGGDMKDIDDLYDMENYDSDDSPGQ